MSLDYERPYYEKGLKLIVGLDEAGRGCLLGPVVAAAVILPSDFYHPLINDSKKLSAKQRKEAFEIIKEHAIEYAIGECSVEEIDKMNILEASREAFMRALKQIKTPYLMSFAPSSYKSFIKNFPSSREVRKNNNGEFLLSKSILNNIFASNLYNHFANNKLVENSTQTLFI